MERFQSWDNFAVDDLIDSLMGVVGKHASIFIDRNVYALRLVKLVVFWSFLAFHSSSVYGHTPVEHYCCSFLFPILLLTLFS